MKRLSRSAILEHDVHKLYGLVEDIEEYPRFLPWCARAEVHERGLGSTRATLTVGVRGVRQSFTTQNTNRRDEGIDMRLVHGPFRHFIASWRFKALAPGACRIEFTLEYEFSNRGLAKLLEPLFNNIADTMVDAFTRRADEVYGRQHHPG
jgi:ribosome-associated toxin RatA of RatAB toxin-antitoxin module